MDKTSSIYSTLSGETLFRFYQRKIKEKFIAENRERKLMSITAFEYFDKTIIFLNAVCGEILLLHLLLSLVPQQE